MILDAEKIKAGLQSTTTSVTALTEADSTNSEALRQLESVEGDKFSVVASAQTAGRGRHGRSWMSESGAGLYFSHARKFSPATRELQALSLVTALATVEALNALGAADLRVKWPNDVLHQGRKLAGILLERRDRHGSVWIVFGIGINLQLTEAQRLAIGRPVCSLNELTATAVDPNVLAAGLIDRLDWSIGCYQREGFAPFLEQWNNLDNFRGTQVVLDQGSHKLSGRSEGVDAAGRLLLSSAGKTQSLEFGELFPSLQPAPRST